jgi:uncharacterized protein YukE
MAGANITVDTDKVLNASTQIDTYNNNIKDHYKTVDDAIAKTLKDHWKGAAYDHACQANTNIRTTFLDARHTAMDNYSTFLKNQIKGGYEEAEEVNTEIADALDS